MPDTAHSDAVTGLTGLVHLLSPVTPDHFVAHHWDSAPLVVPDRGADWYSSLFTLKDFDAALSHNSLRYPFIRLVKGGTPVQISGGDGSGRLPSNHIEEIFSHHRQGATIVLQFLHEWHPGLKRLAAELSMALTATTQINAYLTPPGQRGLNIHYDTHDVFVLQIAGCKQWELYERTTLTPFRNEMGLISNSREDAPTRSLTLEQGDCLYLPAGWVHRAASPDCTSLHLTIGAHPIRRAQVMQQVVETVLRTDPEMRRALPPGFAQDQAVRRDMTHSLTALWSDLASRLNPALFTAAVSEAARRTRRTDLEGHLCDLAALDTLTQDSLLDLRETADPHCIFGKEEISLSFHGKTLSLPEALEPCLRGVLEMRRFRLRDLPGPLDPDDRITFARRLIEEGLLTFAQSDPLD